MIKVGDTLKLEDGYEMEEHGKKIRIKTYKVIAVMKNTVLLVDNFGLKRCVPNGDLIRMGYMKQEPKYEALRRERNRIF